MLAEIGLELPSHPPQPLTTPMMTGSTVRVTMGCLDSEKCPAQLKTLELRDWGLPDPAKLDDEGFRRVRDDLRRRVEELARELSQGDRGSRSVETPHTS